MADDNPTIAGGAGPINPLSPFAFMLGGGSDANLSLEEIKRRRAIALALASRQRGYPKTLGEGMTYLGESIGDRLAEERLAAQEKAYGAKRAADPLFAPPGGGASSSVPFGGAGAGNVSGLSTPPGVASLDPTLGAAPPPPGFQSDVVMSDAAPVGGVGDQLALSRYADPGRAPLPTDLSPRGVPAEPPPPPAAPLPPAPTLPPRPSMSLAPEENDPTVVDIQPMSARTQIAQAPAGIAVGGVAGAPGVAMGPNQPPLPAPPGAAVAAPAGGGVPTVFDPPTPSPAAPAIPMVPPDAQKPLVKPAMPRRDNERLTNEELRGMAILRNYPGDEVAEKQAGYLIGYGKTRRDEAYARRVKEYEADVGKYEKEALAREEYARNFPKLQREHQEATDTAAHTKRMRELFPDGVDKAFGRAKESYETVRQIPTAQAAISNVKQLLASDAGMFTGADANIKLSLSKWAAAAGVPFDPRVGNTETFRGLITPILAALRPAVVGPGAQSLPEMKLLQDAAAGNITLERKSIENILGAIEKLNARAVVQHHKALMANSRGDANVQASIFGNYELPMEQFVPPKAVQLLREQIGRDPSKARTEMEEFDRDYFTPGLAAKLLKMRR